MEQNISVSAPGAKIASVLALVGITTWADFASVVAAIYTLILIGEWLFNRFGRPYFEHKGWMRRRRRRWEDMRRD